MKFTNYCFSNDSKMIAVVHSGPKSMASLSEKKFSVLAYSDILRNTCILLKAKSIRGSENYPCSDSHGAYTQPLTHSLLRCSRTPSVDE